MVIRLLTIAILFIPDMLLSDCIISNKTNVTFDGSVLWEWKASEAVSPLDKPMPESFKRAFKDSSSKQVLYQGSLHLLLMSIGNLALVRFEDKAVIWSAETNMNIETAFITDNGNVIAYNHTGFSECHETN